MAEAKTYPTPQFFDHLLESMTEGFLVLDQRGMVASANQAAAAILGYEPETLIGLHYGVFWPEDSSFLDEPDGDEFHSIEAAWRHNKGHMVSVMVSVSPISTETTPNRLVSITGSANVHQLNEALSHTQKLAGIGTLTASVAHELNTPISIIAATCGNLLHEVDEKSLDDERLMYYVRMIEESAWRCARIVGVLRNYTVEDKLQMAVTDLNMIIGDAVRLVRHQFQGDFNIEVETDLQPDLKSIVCDHNRITQVLINLLTNARDAMLPNGGNIKLRTWTMPSGVESPQADSANRENQVERLAFSVQDSGHGISPENVDKIFRPFFTTKVNGKGTGLGLFVARRIVTQHHGQIWAENHTGGGTIFTVALPRTQSPADMD
jgi:PAS domain S-box-containing protein